MARQLTDGPNVYNTPIEGEARDWLDKEQSKINSDMETTCFKFLKPNSSQSKTTTSETKITIFPRTKETFNEAVAWERFKDPSSIAVILKKLPKKLGDSCRFTIPCDFSKLKCQGLADLGASINLMPLSVFHRLGFTNLESTQMTLELANRQLCRPDGICKDVLVPVGKFTYPADFVVVDYAPDEQIPLILGRPFLRTARALIDVYDEKLILRDGNESLTLNMQSEKSKLNGIQRVESINMIDIFNIPNYIGFKDLFAQMYSGSPTIQSDDSFPSSSPMKTSDSTFEEFTDEFTLPNSLPPGDDVSILKKDFQEDTFRIISNPLFEFDNSFKSSNVNPLFEEKDKDVKIKSSTFVTLTSPEENVSIPPGIDLTLPPTFKVSSSNPTSPTLTGEKVCSWKTPMFFSLVRFVWKMMTRIAIRKKIICLLATYLNKKPKPLSQEVEEIKEKEDEISSEIPIHTIVMPIRITFDNPIDFNDHFSKPKDFKKDLTVKLDSNESSILQPPLLDSGSPFTAELSASVTLNSLGNEDKVFNPGILVYHAIHDKNLVTLEDNLKENISSGTLLVFKEPSEDFVFDPGIITFHKPVVRINQKSQESSQKRASTDTRIRRVQKEAKESKPKPEKSSLSQNQPESQNCHSSIDFTSDSSSSGSSLDSSLDSSSGSPSDSFEAFRHWRSAPLSTPYPPTTSESSLDSSSKRSLDSSLLSAGPSRKRCRSLTTSVPSSTPVSRSIAPTHVDLLPPRKRF
ncbi:reverse transcriptase domain-containing protein [Tanacetum coccineum]